MEKNIVGTWILKKFQIKNNDGIRDWRSNSHGTLIYTSDGYVSVNINSDFKNNDEYMDSILSYSGKYKMTENKIIHTVTNASLFERIGKIMERDYLIDGNILTLIGKGDFGEAILQWERVAN
ncbi:lipocalin-like domain-containing protein [Fluviispira vulneris]|uniref:lipocalin-like domain-containing protein n=1 Tax=Fluviispira vulneris TaxID=2763012 RepID=UPI0016471A3A|nr:lipocalin-like domain-containing protein [Fluviispira vulneris]